MDKVEFGKYIENTRKVLGWSAEKLASELNCNRQTLRRWEQGITAPVEKFDQITQQLEQTLDEYREFGEFLHNMRMSIGWSEYKMGQKLGHTSSTISNWEKGISYLKIVDMHELERKIREVVKEELHQRRLTLLTSK